MDWQAIRNEHIERLLAMRDDTGETWDHSPRDQAAIAWIVNSYLHLEKRLADIKATVNYDPQATDRDA